MRPGRGLARAPARWAHATVWKAWVSVIGPLQARGGGFSWAYADSRRFYGATSDSRRLSEGLSLSSVQFSRSVVSDSSQPHGLRNARLLSVTNSRGLLKLLSIQSVMRSNHLILCRPLLLPSTFPSFRVPSNESVLRIMWPKYWSFSSSFSQSFQWIFRTDLVTRLEVGEAQTMAGYFMMLLLSWAG